MYPDHFSIIAIAAANILECVIERCILGFPISDKIFSASPENLKYGIPDSFLATSTSEKEIVTPDGLHPLTALYKASLAANLAARHEAESFLERQSDFSFSV